MVDQAVLLLAIRGLRYEPPRWEASEPPVAADIAAASGARGIGKASLRSSMPVEATPVAVRPPVGAPPGGGGAGGSGGGGGGAGGGVGSGGGGGGGGGGGDIGEVLVSLLGRLRPTGVVHPLSALVTAETSGGTADTEVRVFGPIGHPFKIIEVAVVPLGGAVVGTFFDVLVGADGDTADTTAPQGGSIFRRPTNFTLLTAPDKSGGVAIPVESTVFRPGYVVRSAGQFVKVRVYAVTPAVAIPSVQVVVSIEELEVVALGAAPRVGGPLYEGGGTTVVDSYPGPTGGGGSVPSGGGPPGVWRIVARNRTPGPDKVYWTNGSRRVVAWVPRGYTGPPPASFKWVGGESAVMRAQAGAHNWSVA